MKIRCSNCGNQITIPKVKEYENIKKACNKLRRLR
jgi:hypothetical protein|tara:strand:- start:1969 stop:2073 length:105 start_codon:yes stop_codon:yes gene_type:complete